MQAAHASTRDICSSIRLQHLRDPIQQEHPAPATSSQAPYATALWRFRSRACLAADSGADGGPGNAAEGDGLGVRRVSDSSAEGGGGHGTGQARAQAYDRSSLLIDMRDVIAAIRLSPQQGAAFVQVRPATMLST